MPIPRRLRVLLERAPAGARRGFGLGGAADLGLRRRHRLLLALDLAAHGFALSLDFGEAVLAGEPARRAGRRIGADGEAVPAPEVTFTRHQALTRLEQRKKPRGLIALDHADLRQAPRQLLRRLDVLGERMHPIRQRRVIRVDRGPRPAHGRGWIDGRFEIIAERGAQCGLVALVDAHVIECGRPQRLSVHVQKLGQCPRFGVQTLRAALRLGERTAGHLERLAGGGMRGFRAHGCGFRLGGRRLRRFRRLR